MSKKIDIPTEGPLSDVPETKVGRMLTGDDYKESLLVQAKLEKALTGKPGMIPKRQLIFRVADVILTKLNKLDTHSENDPNSVESRQLDQLHFQFGTDNVVDLAMVLANLEMKNKEKQRFKDILGDSGLGLVTKDKTKGLFASGIPQYLTAAGEKDFKDHVDKEAI